MSPYMKCKLCGSPAAYRLFVNVVVDICENCFKPYKIINDFLQQQEYSGVCACGNPAIANTDKCLECLRQEIREVLLDIASLGLPSKEILTVRPDFKGIFPIIVTADTLVDLSLRATVVEKLMEIGK